MKEKKNRKYWQIALAPLVPLVVIGGYFWPYLGYIAIAMLVFMLMLALFRGRYYCGWFCAMGSFHERILSLVSRRKKMLPIFKVRWFRWVVFVLMMSLLASRLILAGGDPDATISADMLPQDVGSMIPAMPTGNNGEHIMGLPLREAREVFERDYLIAQISRFSGNISRTAEFVGMERSALHRKLKALGVG